MNNTHPALQVLDFFTKIAGFDMEVARNLGLKNPDRVFATSIKFGEAITAALVDSGKVKAADLFEEVTKNPVAWSAYCEIILTMATWRMTRGIYRVDESLYADLAGTELAGDLPVELLKWLPEWCIYIETPELQTPDGQRVLGAWARSDEDEYGEPTLCVQLNLEGEPQNIRPYSIFLQSGKTLEEVLKINKERWQETGTSVRTGESESMAAQVLQPIINILIYISNQIAEVQDEHGQPPANPEPKKVKRGVRLFAKPKPTVFNVGVRMGAALRQARQAISNEIGTTGKGKAGEAPHVRRAHWHSWRYGARKRPDGSAIPAHMRPLRVQWLPPIAVNFDFSDEIETAVIRPVKRNPNE